MPKPESKTRCLQFRWKICPTQDLTIFWKKGILIDWQTKLLSRRWERMQVCLRHVLCIASNTLWWCLAGAISAPYQPGQSWKDPRPHRGNVSLPLKLALVEHWKHLGPYPLLPGRLLWRRDLQCRQRKNHGHLVMTQPLNCIFAQDSWKFQERGCRPLDRPWPWSNSVNPREVLGHHSQRRPWSDQSAHFLGERRVLPTSQRFEPSPKVSLDDLTVIIQRIPLDTSGLQWWGSLAACPCDPKPGSGSRLLLFVYISTERQFKPNSSRVRSVVLPSDPKPGSGSQASPRQADRICDPNYHRRNSSNESQATQTMQRFEASQAYRFVKKCPTRPTAFPAISKYVTDALKNLVTKQCIQNDCGPRMVDLVHWHAWSSKL